VVVVCRSGRVAVIWDRLDESRIQLWLRPCPKSTPSPYRSTGENLQPACHGRCGGVLFESALCQSIPWLVLGSAGFDTREFVPFQLVRERHRIEVKAETRWRRQANAPPRSSRVEWQVPLDAGNTNRKMGITPARTAKNLQAGRFNQCFAKVNFLGHPSLVKYICRSKQHIVPFTVVTRVALRAKWRRVEGD
jgi:hypothetical protein